MLGLGRYQATRLAISMAERSRKLFIEKKEKRMENLGKELKVNLEKKLRKRYAERIVQEIMRRFRPTSPSQDEKTALSTCMQIAGDVLRESARDAVRETKADADARLSTGYWGD